MGTQAVVSIVDEQGKTIVKAVCGCDGYYAPQLAEKIATKQAHTAKQVYDLARTLHFGCDLCLVVIDKTNTMYRGGLELSALYRSTFDDPNFNPRWEYGTADYTRVVVINTPSYQGA